MTPLEIQSLQAANRAREAGLDPAAEQTIQRTIARTFVFLTAIVAIIAVYGVALFIVGEPLAPRF